MTVTPSDAAITPAVYSSDEVISHFIVLLKDTTFSTQLHYLGARRAFISPRRRRARQELQAMFIGLWKLALDSSFPAQAKEIFDDFLEKYSQGKPAKKSEQMCEKIRNYAEMLKTCGDKDFTNIASHVISKIKIPRADCPKAALALALDIRSFYQIIFDRLI
jgi:hypothetical protein